MLHPSLFCLSNYTGRPLNSLLTAPPSWGEVFLELTMSGRTRETSKNKLFQQQEIGMSSLAFLISHLSDCDSLSALLFNGNMSGIFHLSVS